MARTVELGRAVLSSTTAQLWLRILITVSPQQESIDIQGHTQTALLDLLHSGDVWICRGNGMHLDLELSIEGEPIGTGMRETLAARIIKAPVWEQLLLTASLPDVQEQGDSPDDKKLRVYIRHSHTANSPEKQNHRLGVNVPFSDVKPPDGVPILGLDSIRFVMELVRCKLSSRNKKRKRLSDTPTDTRNKTLNIQQSAIYEASHADGADIVEAVGVFSLSMTESNSHVSHETSPFYEKTQLDTLDVERLVDHALRLSVNNVNPKSATGVTIDANSISVSLSHIAPNLWRPEYLQGFSRRSHFLPTIAHSIVRTASSKARSMSLKDKLDRLTGDAAGSSCSSMASKNGPCKTDVTHAHLWNYLQRSLTNKAASVPLKSFSNYGAGTELPIQQDSNSILSRHTSPLPMNSASGSSGVSLRKRCTRTWDSEEVTSSFNDTSNISKDETDLWTGNTFADYTTGVDIPSSDELLFSPMSTRKIALVDVNTQSRSNDCGLKLSSHAGSEKLNYIPDEQVEESSGPHILRHSDSTLLEGSSKPKLAEDGSRLPRQEIASYESQEPDLIDFDLVPII